MKKFELIDKTVELLNEIEGCRAIQFPLVQLSESENARKIGGFPHILAIRKGRAFLFWVQCKGKNSTTTLQLYEIESWRESGCFAAVILNPTEAVEVIEEMQEGYPTKPGAREFLLHSLSQSSEHLFSLGKLSE